jgi:hypothetical protein
MFRLFSVTLLLALSVPALAQQIEASDGVTDEIPSEDSGQWLWSVTPYIWAVDTEVDLTVDDNPAGGGKVTFSDLLDTLDTAFQVVVETGKEGGNWSAFIDLTYIDASDANTANAEGTDVRIDTDSTQIFIDAAVAYWPQGVDGDFSLFGGIRYTDLDDDYDLSDADSGAPIDSLSSSRDFTDVLLGGRYMFDLAERWSILTKADYSFGDSEGIWQLQAMVRYAVGSQLQHGIIVGYRYKEAEFEAGGVNEDYEFKGPAAAFNFRF